MKKLRIATESVRIGEQELVKVNVRFKDRRGRIKDKRRINYLKKNCKRLEINPNQSNN